MLLDGKVRTFKKEKESLGLVVFAPEFIVAFRMLADWAFFGRGFAFEDVAAVSALPHRRLVSVEHVSALHVG